MSTSNDWLDYNFTLDNYTTTTSSGTITVNTTCDTMDTMWTGDNITVTGIDLSDITIPPIKPTMKIGNTEIDELTFKKLNAIIKVIENLEDENALKQMFDAQIMLDEIRGQSET